MIKIEVKKDNKGNIVLSQDSFEMILMCLANQKFLKENPPNGEAFSLGKEKYDFIQENMQNEIDNCYKQCIDFLHKKILIVIEQDGCALTKKYENDNSILEWTKKDIEKIKNIIDNNYYNQQLLMSPGITTMFIDDHTEILKHKNSKEHQNVIAENYKGQLTISDNGNFYRAWKKEEIDAIKNLFI